MFIRVANNLNFISFESNCLGRDFICADIHGHFTILENLLSRYNFDPTIDRLFSLGDMIDRGDESYKVLDWIDKPWFNPIQGNHERMLINAVERGSVTTRRQWFMWGGDWAENFNTNELERYYHAIKSLPAAIEIKLSEPVLIGLVHAELPNQCDWKEVKHRLENAPSNIELDPFISNLIWSRAQPYYNDSERQAVTPVKNIHHVFHGHSIVKQITTITNRTFMDLGSYDSGQIGFIEVKRFLDKNLCNL